MQSMLADTLFQSSHSLMLVRLPPQMEQYTYPKGAYKTTVCIFPLAGVPKRCVGMLRLLRLWWELGRA